MVRMENMHPGRPKSGLKDQPGTTWEEKTAILSYHLGILQQDNPADTQSLDI